MRSRAIAVLFAATFGLAAIAGCKSPKTPAEAIASLKSPDPHERQRAADDLRTDHGVPPEAVPPLLQAAQTEQDPRALGAILITLGRSGSPDAKPLIDSHIVTKDKDMRRWASRALKYWMIATGKMPEKGPWPDGWPYGQPGYPDKLPQD